MAELVLFGSRISALVEKVVRALRLKDLEFRLVGPKGPGDLRKWNPQTGKMPVLQWDGERLYDSTFILRELDRRVPKPQLFSGDPRAAAHQRQLEDWADESLYWLVMGLRWCERNAAASAAQITGGLPLPGFVKPLVRSRIRRQLTAMTEAQGTGRLPHPVLCRELGRHLDDLVMILGDRPFFFGDAPSAADLALFGELEMGTSGPTPEVGEALDRRPELRAWRERVERATGG